MSPQARQHASTRETATQSSQNQCRAPGWPEPGTTPRQTPVIQETIGDLRKLLCGSPWAVADDEPVLLAEVAAELAKGVPGYPALGSAAAEGWLKQAELEDLPELAAFARYKGELGGGPERNNGEAAVLAWVSVNGGVAIIDEVAARAMGARERLQVHGSLWLLIRSFKSRVHDRVTVEAIVDDLIGTGMRLPVDSGAALFAWAYGAGILP